MDGFGISILGAFNDIFSDDPSLAFLPRWTTFQPFSEPRAHQPVTQILLVKAGLSPSWLVSFDRPIPRRVRCKQFVDEDELFAGAFRYEAEFEFGVGENNTATASVVCSGCVEFQGC